MGRSKKHQYTQQELNVARIGRAIAASARVVILHEISMYHIITNKYISERVNLSGAAVSQHLQILRETGFIESKYLGKMNNIGAIPSQSKAKSIFTIFRELYKKRQPETDWRSHYN